MHVKQYNDTATRGRYEINSYQLDSIFPEANQFLIDYILDRSYVNKKDIRVRREGNDVIPYHKIVFDAVATAHDDDKFDSHDGEMIVKLKLHDKAARFLNEFRLKLVDDCSKMKDRIQYFPCSILKNEVICADVPRRSGTLMDYSITDTHSYAKWAVPMDGNAGYTTIRNMCIAIADYACEALRYRKNVDYIVNSSIQRFTSEFAEEIEDKLTSRMKHLGGGNWRVEKANGNVRRIVITAHTRRSPEDKHDPNKAARELVKTLNRSFCKLERIARKIAIQILDRYAQVGRIAKAVKTANAARQYCLDHGLVKEGCYTLQAVNELLKAKR